LSLLDREKTKREGFKNLQLKKELLNTIKAIKMRYFWHIKTINVIMKTIFRSDHSPLVHRAVVVCNIVGLLLDLVSIVGFLF
jgi:hypothetical protein